MMSYISIKNSATVEDLCHRITFEVTEILALSFICIASMRG
jgi:hypothetical protein